MVGLAQPLPPCWPCNFPDLPAPRSEVAVTETEKNELEKINQNFSEDMKEETCFCCFLPLEMVPVC